jgi:hypothetical protein
MHKKRHEPIIGGDGNPATAFILVSGIQDKQQTTGPSKRKAYEGPRKKRGMACWRRD